MRAIRAAVDLHIQLGGGIRDRAAIDYWLGLGIDRVVLGTAALRDPELVRQAARELPGRIVVGIDARDGRVAVEGWAETSDIGAVELGRRFADAGVAAIVYTDIARDGALTGIDAAATAAFARSGRGAGHRLGRRRLARRHRGAAAHEGEGIAGAICGRALYDGRLDPSAALHRRRRRA